MTEAPSQMAARTLKLVANCIIKLANLAEAKVRFLSAVLHALAAELSTPSGKLKKNVSKNSSLLCCFQESFMELINQFIRDNQQRMVMFLDELSVRIVFKAFIA